MKALLLPLTLYCISLFSLQLQALPVGDRLDLMTRLSQLREGSPESDPGSVDATANPVVPLDRTALWRALLFRKPPASFEDPMSIFRVPHTSRPVAGASTEKGEGPNQTGLRSRRHAFIRGHHPQRHGQLMRVGCVLGTCQVQNLSHRLYQLVGQTGREDSSPVNPRSPHSYG
ncbi:protein ADM2a [Pygocentrus nattereri]|uniref:Adrenomedullin 2b n=1 Tax=Pygocentrus nattereri TaxID=42514 RepID=A0A3B4BVW6_PYGNA|nr:protein ADM2a [Pygocentrus nattereri]